jgi:RNA polymerase sigma-70 factor (ECF subfamily)
VKTEIACFDSAGTWAFAGMPETGTGALEMSREGEQHVSRTVFWELFAPCKHKLYNYIHKSMNFSVEADDIFQNTVLRALQYLDSYEGDRDFAPWLFAIAHNEIRDHFRRAARESNSFEPESVAAKDSNVLQELVQEVYRLAAHLKPRQREIFFLFYDEGFNIAEIAKITGSSETNVKFQLFRARNALKKILGV